MSQAVLTQQMQNIREISGDATDTGINLEFKSLCHWILHSVQETLLRKPQLLFLGIWLCHNAMFVDSKNVVWTRGNHTSSYKLGYIFIFRKTAQRLLITSIESDVAGKPVAGQSRSNRQKTIFYFITQLLRLTLKLCFHVSSGTTELSRNVCPLQRVEAKPACCR